MKLDRIEIYGFKSFARRTEFEFDAGITAVVGPNGCGKSNLVDALRWALGEQRPKLLRSSSMPDVVYRGASARIDAAEVTLTFDNSDGRMSIDAPEVQITRSLSRDGISGYQINGRTARLKDLRELLLDTGLGVGGYSFMEQGRIDYILNASALERRILVEEAAGTSRYRLRRKEALRKLDRTEQDLSRAGDMIGELERQVRSLKVQAGRARNYVDKRDRLHRIMQVAYVRRHAQLQEALAQILAEREIVAQQEIECREEVGMAETSLTEREQVERNLSAEVGEARTEMVERRAQSKHLESRSADLERRLEGIAEEQQSCQDRGAQLDEQRQSLVDELAAAETARQELTARSEASFESKAEVEEELRVARRDEEEVDQRGERLQEEVLVVVEEQQRIRDQVADLDSELRALEGRRGKLEARIEEISTESRELRGRARVDRDRWREHATRRQGLETELSANDEELSRLYQRRQELSEELEKDSAFVAANRSRLAVLEDAITRHEGLDEQVRGLLERAKKGEAGLEKVLGVVADMITASPDTAVAVEAALGPWAEALVVPDRDAAIEVLRVLRDEGAHRVRILSLAELLRSQNGHRLRTALLQGARLEETSKTLLPALLSRFDLLPPDVPMDLCSPRPGRAIVASDGEMMLHRFETISRGRADRVGLITRRSERDRLSAELEKAQGKLDALRERLQDVVRQIGEREKDREEKGRERDQITIREREALQAFRASIERLKLLREELGMDRRESVELRTRGQSIQDERAQHEERRAAVDERREELQERRQGLHDARQGAAEKRKQIEQRLGEIDLETARLAERLDAARQAAEALSTRQREREEEWHHLESRRAELDSQGTSVREELAGNAVEIERLGEEQAITERVVSERTAALQEYQEATRELRDRVGRLRRELEQAARKRQEYELKEQERRLHAQGLVDRVMEDLGVDPHAVAEFLARGRFHPPAPDPDEEDPDSEEEEEEVDPGPRIVVQRSAGPLPMPSSSTEDEAASEDGDEGEDDRGEHDGEAPEHRLPEDSTEDGVSLDGAREDDGEDGPEEDSEDEAAMAAQSEEPEPEEEEEGPDAEEIAELQARDLDELQTEVDSLRTALQRLGPVNLDAIDDLEEVEGRARFFAEQREDLIESRRSLKKMIEEIDKECEVRFAETFSAVREQFKVLFRRLFRGGRADLILLEADDPSEQGVDIVAAPPGKDPRSIAMLSGGERTMTATALLFSLFSTRPSPFCVLDEVDAALDEANIERFTDMVKEFVGSTQFVIVTHSKRTMSAADMMYGVTMEGDGVSRPISMKFEAESEERPRRFAEGRKDLDSPERARGAGA